MQALIQKLRATLGGMNRWDGLFWAAWVTCTALLIAPLWVGALPPLRDFGSHVTMAEVWTRFDDVPAYREIFGVRLGFYPNLLSVRFASVLYPLLEPGTSVRLFVTLSLLGTSLAMVWVLHVYARSRWLVFGALPFMWGGMLALGLVNYVLAFPLMLGGLAVGRLAGQRGGWGSAFAILALGFLAYLAHGLAYCFVAGLTTLALLLALRRWRHVLHGLALVPSAAVWVWWIFDRKSQERLGNPVDADESGFSIVYHQGVDSLTWFLRQTMDITIDHADTTAMWTLLMAWVVMMATSRGGEAKEGKAQLASASPVLKWLSSVRAELDRHALLVVALVLAAGVAWLPAYVNEVALSSRLITPMWLVLAAVPTVRPAQSKLAAAAVAVSMVVCVGFGVHLIRSMETFHNRELAPIQELLTHVPEHANVECLGVQKVESVYFRRPLEQTCHALVQHTTHGYSGPAFANTGHNALWFLDGVRPSALRNTAWQTNTRTLSWDYLVIRGEHVVPGGELVEEVARVEATDDHGADWTLYKVLQPEPFVAAFQAMVGGDGGTPAMTPCDKGQVAESVSVRVSARGRGMGVAQLHCRGVSSGQGKPTFTGTAKAMLEFGNSKPTAHVRCPPGQLIVGLHGHADKLIQSLGAVCAPRRVGANGDQLGLGTVTETEAIGAARGDPFRLVCPERTVVRGLIGRGGSLVDAIGIVCAGL